MAKSKIRERISRETAADMLTKVAGQLRWGFVSLGDKLSIPVSNEVELKTEIEDDELKFELKWRPVTG